MSTPVNKASGRRIPPLQAALRVLRRDGPAQLTMRTVAAEAGVTATALYRHFDNKEDLLRAVIREAYAVFRSYLTVALDGSDPGVWLQLGFSRYLDFALRHPHDYEILFVTAHGLAIDHYPDDFRSGRSATFRHLTGVVRACMEAGVLREDDPADVALTLYAHMHGLVMLHRSGRFRDDDEVFRGFYFASLGRLVEGLG